MDSLGLMLAAVQPLDCGSARPLISAQLDGEASPEEAALAAGHLSGCTACRADRMRWSSLGQALLIALPAGAPSPATDARIRGLARRRPVAAGPRWLHVAPWSLMGGFTPVRTLVPVAVAAMVVVLAVLAALPTQGPGAPAVAPLAREEAGPVTLVASISPQAVLNALTNTVYVLQPDSGVIVARNATTNAVVAEIIVGGAPSALALNSVTNALYVLDAGAKTLTEISGSTNSVVSRVAVPVSGRPTSVDVNPDSGKVVIAAAAARGTDGAGQLAVIDGTSRTVDLVRTVDVAPTSVVVNARANRMYLLGSGSTSVVDATTYAPLATLPAVVAIAASTVGSNDALLVDVAGGSRVQFFGSQARADIPGRAVTIVALPDGTFGALTDVDGKGRITLVAASGEVQGSLSVATTARSLNFDAATLRFFGASGQPVAQVARGQIAPATATPAPAPTVRSTPVPTAAPAAVALPAAVLPFILPLPVAPIPGATIAAEGVYRLSLDGHRVVAAAGAGERIWFVDQRGELLALDTASGRLTSLVQLGRDLSGARLVVAARTIFIVDQAAGALISVDIASGRQATAELPVRGTVVGLADAGGDHLWLAMRGGASLVDFDARSRRFALVPLPAGSAVSALGADLSGRAWFADSARPSSFFTYEPGLLRISEFGSPAGGAITRIIGDPSGQVWLGTASGELFTVNAGRISPVRRLGGAVLDLAAAAGSSWFLAGGSATSVGLATGGQTTQGPANGRVLAVDGAGRAWVSGPTLDAFFVVEPR